MLVEESFHVVFDESIVSLSSIDHVDENTLQPRIENRDLEENEKLGRVYLENGDMHWVIPKIWF